MKCGQDWIWWVEASMPIPSEIAHCVQSSTLYGDDLNLKLRICWCWKECWQKSFCVVPQKFVQKENSAPSSIFTSAYINRRAMTMWRHRNEMFLKYVDPWTPQEHLIVILNPFNRTSWSYPEYRESFSSVGLVAGYHTSSFHECTLWSHSSILAQ